MVSDNGDGIDEHIGDAIFNKFLQAKNRRKIKPQGSGLGLAICKRILDLHNAPIAYLPKGKHNGASFYFEIPLKIIQMSYKILVADDDPYILMSLEFLMKKNKYQVHIARDGAEAFSIIQDVKPDLAILDIMMPEMNGYELCTQIKANPQTSHCDVIFLSAKSRQQDLEKGYSIGATLYVSKPFSTKNLVQKVEEILSKKIRQTQQCYISKPISTALKIQTSFG